MKMDIMNIEFHADVSRYCHDIERSQSLSVETRNRIEKRLKVWGKWQAAVDRAYFKLKRDHR